AGPGAGVTEPGPAPRAPGAARRGAGRERRPLGARFRLLADGARRGEAEEARRLFTAFAAPLAGKLGLSRIELQVELVTRRHEELRAGLLAQAQLLVKEPNERELSLAEDLLSLAAPFNAGQETLAILRALEPV